MMAEYEVELAENDRVGDFYVKFCGPVDSKWFCLAVCLFSDVCVCSC